MPRVLFVCTANICRSPVAEVILRDRLRQIGVEGWHVSSAGTWALLARGASRYSAQLMAEQGLDLADHVARMIDEDLLQQADLILCMETGHAEALGIEFPDYKHKVHLLSEMVGRHHSIGDPYGGPIEGYRAMVAEVKDLIDGGLERIVALATANATSRL